MTNDFELFSFPDLAPIRIYPTADSKAIHMIKQATFGGNEDDIVICGSHCNKIFIFDTVSSRRLETVSTSLKSVRTLAYFNYQDRHLIAGSCGGTVALWEKMAHSQEHVFDVAISDLWTSRLALFLAALAGFQSLWVPWVYDTSLKMIDRLKPSPNVVSLPREVFQGIRDQPVAQDAPVSPNVEEDVTRDTPIPPGVEQVITQDTPLLLSVEQSVTREAHVLLAI
ncbi:hypothetical protein ONZ45_g19553 [Pleurotus djamor]|nr:hypothetical protein ONZ45_g19553 [Pleurotus djamor]